MINFAGQAWVEAIGWTLIHSLWQGALVAAAVALLAVLLPRAKPGLQYAVACAGLLAVALAGVITLAGQARQHIEPVHKIAAADAIAVTQDGDLPAPPAEEQADTSAVNAQQTLVSADETSPAEPVAAAGWRGAMRESVTGWLDALRPWLPAIVALWAIGVGVLSARLLLQWRSIRRESRGRRPIDDPALLACLRRIAGRLGIRRPVGLFACTSASVPFVLGWLKPAILLPAALLSGLNAAELEAIIAHELAHIRRHDYLVNLLQSLVETIYFYHPGVWWISRLARQQREFCCDEMAALACGDRVVYGRALAALEQWRGEQTRLQIAANGGSLVERIRRLTDTDPPRSYRPGAVFLTILALFGVAVVLAAVEPTHAEPDEKAEKVTAPAVEPEAPAPEPAPTPAEPDKTPQKITVATVEAPAAVTITTPYVAQIHSQRHIHVRVLQRGYLESIPVKEGQHVKAGDKMFSVIPILYKARYDVAKAEADYAQLEYNYTKKLSEEKGQGVVSQNDVFLLKAKLEKANANAHLAEAELGFSTVKAPFDGIIGRLQHQQGELVLEGETLTTLSDNSLMWVYFNVPESRYLEYKTAGLDENKDDLKFELGLANGVKFDQPAKLGAIDADFNNQNGNIPFRVDVPNPKGLLRHGQTGTVFVSRAVKDVIVIPQRATFELLAKRYVYVVDKDNVAHQRQIACEHGDELGDRFIVKKGLAAGDKIVVDGIRQIHDGDKVEY